jgi:hypothetical protein
MLVGLHSPGVNFEADLDADRQHQDLAGFVAFRWPMNVFGRLVLARQRRLCARPARPP